MREERGVAAVELAMVMPLLMLMLAAIIDFGARYAYAAKMDDAARSAARDMSITNSSSHAQAAGVTAGAPSTGTAWSISTCVVDGNTTVTLTTTAQTVTGVFGKTYQIKAKAVARCQI